MRRRDSTGLRRLSFSQRRPSCCKRRLSSSGALRRPALLEGVLAGQSGVARTERRQLLDRFTPQPFTALSALLGEAAKRHQNARWRTRAQRAPAFEQAPLLHVSV